MLLRLVGSFRHLVFDEQRALGGVREVGRGPLHHQLEGCVGRDVVQVVSPQDAAGLTVDAKELQRDRRRRSGTFSSLFISASSWWPQTQQLRGLVPSRRPSPSPSSSAG